MNKVTDKEKVVKLEQLIKELLNQSQFFLSTIEAKDPMSSDFTDWEKRAKALVKGK